MVLVEEMWVHDPDLESQALLALMDEG